MASRVPGNTGNNGNAGNGSTLGEKIGGCLGQLGCSVVIIAILLGIGASCDSDSDSNPEDGDVCYDIGEEVTNSAGETFVCGY